METTEPDWRPQSSTGALSASGGQGIDATATVSGQAPPATPTPQPSASSPVAPLGAALWMAFVFGLSCATYWALVSNVLTVTLQLFVLSPRGDHPDLLFATLGFLLVIAAPVAVIVVAWRERRRTGWGGGLVLALLALAVVSFGPATLVIALALTPQTTSLASALATWIDPFAPLDLFRAMPPLVVFGMAASVGPLALASAYAWGAAPGGMALRWLAPLRWAAVGLSATLGYILVTFGLTLLRSFISYPQGQLALQQTVTVLNQQVSFSYLLALTLIASALGGALAWLGARAGGDGADKAPLVERRAPRRWGRIIGVGVLLVVLGMVSAAWLPVLAWFEAIFFYGESSAVIVVVVALAPMLILIWAYLAMRRVGAASAWRTVGVAALGATPLLFGVLMSVFAGKLSLATLAYLIYVGAQIGLVFGVGVTVGAIFGSAGPARWRGRASAIGALVGLGYALTMYALTNELAYGRTGAQCSGFVGCVLGMALVCSNESFIPTYGVYGLWLALAGGLVGGWLRARATAASAPVATPAVR